MTEDVLQLWDKLKLTDEEDHAVMGDDALDDGNRLQGLRFLISKLLIKKKVNISTMISTMQKLWMILRVSRQSLWVPILLFSIRYSSRMESNLHEAS